MATFLLEIRTEEIPAAALPTTRSQLEKLFSEHLSGAGYDGFETVALSTVRRLAVVVRNLPDRQADRTEDVTGPPLRGSGVKWDIRKVFPYDRYDEIDFEIPIGKNGDTYDRYLVRMEEMRQSLRILHQALDRLEKADGPMDVEDPRITLPRKTDAMNDMESMIHHFKLITEGIRAPVGESYFPVEASKGELGMYVVSDGGTKPVRWRVRPPSFVNLSALPKLLEGHLVADLIAINASIDIVLGEIDR